MRAAVLVEPGRFEVRDVPRPNPGVGEVLIRVSRTGICGTDLHIFHGHYSADKLPLIPGHEFTGTIAECGKGVDEFCIDQSVVVDMNIGCTRCYWCRRNEVLNCPQMQQLGITIDGAFAEYVVVPARLVIKAPENTDPAVLALTEPLACVVRAARKSGVTFGNSVAVIGAGPIGNLHVQLLRTIGAAPIIVTDISDKRVQMALASGADIGCSPAAIERCVMDATDRRGADMVIECVGRSDLYLTAKRLLRKGGHLAAFGITGVGETLPLDILQTILEENSIKGSVAGMGEDMHDSLTLLTHQRIDSTLFTGSTYPLSDIQNAFETLHERDDVLKTQVLMH